MKTNKFEYVHIIQSNYGHGWEDVDCGTRQETSANLKAYRENDKTGVFRRIQKRILKMESNK